MLAPVDLGLQDLVYHPLQAAWQLADRLRSSGCPGNRFGKLDLSRQIGLACYRIFVGCEHLVEATVVRLGGLVGPAATLRVAVGGGFGLVTTGSGATGLLTLVARLALAGTGLWRLVAGTLRLWLRWALLVEFTIHILENFIRFDLGVVQP